MEENKIKNSYTKYKNRIGLSDGKRFLKDNKEVVLNFPFKDCILQGGQNTEEGTDTYFEKDKQSNYQQKKTKRKEIFFNEILAADEIDRLKDEKALVNWKRFDANSHQEKGLSHFELNSESIKRDKNSTIKENLIIKGNNLLVLYSLKKQFYKKIKFIYIDPPYNTGNDTFNYNDNFNHSTWLVFMKNRLEISKELLRDDGVIFISCDDNEQAYLKILCDEIFKRENFIANLIWNNSTGGGLKRKHFNNNYENILCFSKNKNRLNEFYSDISNEAKKMYREKDEKGIFRKQHLIWRNSSKNKNQTYEIEMPDGEKIRPKKGYISRFIKETFQEKRKKGFILFHKSKNSNFENINGTKTDWNISVKDYLKEKKSSPLTLLPKEFVGTNITSINEMNKIFLNKEIFSYSKPYQLIQYLLKITTNKDDIILDFFAGSGTTGHAVLALNKEDGGNRKFILVEQLDKHVDICIERNQKVLAQENLNDSFIYCELAKWNEQVKEQILACESLDELETFFSEMTDRYFLNYNVKIQEFQEKVLKEKEFKNLPLEKQKEMFLTILDLNQMVVCRSEIEDKKFGLIEKDIKMTKEFYQIF